MKRWKKLYGIDGTFTCPYCLKTLPIEQATRDHRIPRSRGGKTSPENIEIVCEKCNNEKGALTPSEYEEWLRLNFIRNGGLSR